MLVKLPPSRTRQIGARFRCLLLHARAGRGGFHAFNSIADSSAVQSLPTDVSKSFSSFLTSLQAYRFYRDCAWLFGALTPMRS